MNALQRSQIRQRLLELSLSGRLRPEDVIADASDESSPLHSQFEWDDTEAARKYRLHQARQLIASVKITITNNGRLVLAPEFVRDPDAEHSEQGYTRVVSLQSDEERALAALMAEARRIASSLDRAIAIAEAIGMDSQLRTILADLEAYRDYVDGAA